MKLIDIENVTLSWSKEDVELYEDDFAGGVLFALDKLTEEVPTIEVPRWIPVTERLPTEEDANEYCGVLAIHRRNTAADIWDFNAVREYSEEFTHWMPLPDAPKDGDSE